MIRPHLRTADILHELKFTASRSSGAGGQHVNKVSSRVTLRWPVNESAVLTDEEKSRLLSKLASRINKAGVLTLDVQESRSQHANREAALHLLDDLLARALKPLKIRKKTKPTAAAAQKRLESKRRRAERKKDRRRDRFS